MACPTKIGFGSRQQVNKGPNPQPSPPFPPVFFMDMTIIVRKMMMIMIIILLLRENYIVYSSLLFCTVCHEYGTSTFLHSGQH